MIERTILTAIVIVLALSMVAAVLPRVTPSLVALGMLALVGRVIWWRTK